MYQRDYILRMVEMLAELVAGILGLIKKGNYKKASQSIDNAYQDLLQQDAAFFNKIDIDKLSDKLLNEHNYNNGHLEILAELFFSQAELFYAQEKYDESLSYYQKSLKLHDFVIKESQTFSFEKQSKLSTIQNRIEELQKSCN